ncbi:unnamed protein product [Parnassius mnemosyne]|uniref:Uncharacterized protein n=1 Tax=Parnassius mnemosyne TaxID=213953 RepID=A0AAV1LPY7_9NEOP
MLNILSYVGMSLQAEVCLWTLLGLVRTIFDATLFKVNANLKQVWQMNMPPELSMSVQRVLRTMVSGVMLVQCFTLYVYLASYIVLLYPVFLEERPTLVLPWLLLAAIRKFLCELTSLALGLGTCVLLGPARPPCVRFLITKIISITPALYMWLLVFSYYHALKMDSAFKTFPAVVPPSDRDFGLELAVRRRRTKSLLGEDQLRRKIIAGLYAERQSITKPHLTTRLKFGETAYVVPSDNSDADVKNEADVMRPMSVTSNRTISDTGTFEDWLNNELVMPRDTDRILEQFATMSLGIVAYLKKDGTDSSKFFDSLSTKTEKNLMNLDCNALSSENTDPPPLVGSSKGKLASYLTDYPQIFMKKASDIFQRKSESNELVDKETENEIADKKGSFSHSYDETAYYGEKSSLNEINNIKPSGESSYVSPNNSNILETDSSRPKTQVRYNEKPEFNITMTPESNSNVSFKNIINDIISRLPSDSVLKSGNRTEHDMESRNTPQSQSTSKSSSSASFK